MCHSDVEIWKSVPQSEKGNAVRITKVEATNLKGRSFSHELSSAVAITGDNFSGKTSIIDAIRLALIGHIPELGKLPAATWQLASAEHMGITLYFDDEPNKNCAVFEMRSGKITQRGRDDLTGIPLLNAAAYFAMSERERYDFVFRIAKMPEQFTRDSIVAELERVSFEEQHTELIQAAKAEIIKGVRIQDGPMSVQQWLEEALTFLKGAYTASNQRQKDTQGAVRVLAELKNKQKDFPGNTRELKIALDKTVAESTAASEVLSKLIERRKGAVTLQERRSRLDQLKTASDTGKEIAELETLIKEATTQVKGSIESKYSEVDRETLRRQVRYLSVGVGQLGVVVQDYNSKLTELKKQVACPYCQSKSKNWKDNLQKLLTERLATAESEAKDKSAELDKLQADLNAAERSIDQAKQDIARNRELNAKILDWSQRIEKVRQRGAEWQRQIEAEEQTLADIGEIAAPTEDELRAAEETYHARAKAQQVASDNLHLAELLEHDLQRAAQAELEHRRAQANVKVIKRFGEILRDKKAMLVDAVFNDLLGVANGIVSGILPTPLAFHEGEVGRWNGHRWISHKTFSGVEMMLTYVAIAAALSQSSPLKLLILDELARLTVSRQKKLMDMLLTLIDQKVIDQAIIVIPTEQPFSRKNWQTIQL